MFHSRYNSAPRLMKSGSEARLSVISPGITGAGSVTVVVGVSDGEGVGEGVSAGVGVLVGSRVGVPVSVPVGSGVLLGSEVGVSVLPPCAETGSMVRNPVCRISMNATVKFKTVLIASHFPPIHPHLAPPRSGGLFQHVH